MLQERSVQYKQRYRSHIHNMTLSDQNQLMTSTGSKDTAAVASWRQSTQSLAWGMHSHRSCLAAAALSHLSVPAWLICVIQQSVPLQLLRVVQYGRSDDKIGY